MVADSSLLIAAKSSSCTIRDYHEVERSSGVGVRSARPRYSAC